MTQPRDTTRLLMEERDRLAARVRELEAALQRAGGCLEFEGNVDGAVKIILAALNKETA